MRDLITALAICNNVTPVAAQPSLPETQNISEDVSSQLQNAKTNAEPVLQASSPDEISLVKFGLDLNMKLVNRERSSCILRNIKGVEEEYEVLAMFPFTSESKKMGVLVKNKKT